MFIIKMYCKGSIKKLEKTTKFLIGKRINKLFSAKNSFYSKQNRIIYKLFKFFHTQYKRFCLCFDFIQFEDFISSFYIRNIVLTKSNILKRPFYSAKGKTNLRKKNFSFIIFYFKIDKTLL